MRNSKITIPLVSLAAVLLISGYVFGISSYTSSFNTRYGAAAGTALGANSSAKCVLCHPNGNTSSYTAYANDFRNNSHNYATIEPMDSDGDGFSNLAEITALTNPSDANSHPAPGVDTTLPVVSTFTVPATATSLTVSITALTATDNVAVTGYLVNESATKPAAGNWPAAAPTSYTFANAVGTKTLYAWARDAAGNVSNLYPVRNVIITLPPVADNTPPTVTGFTIPVTAGSLTVPITLFAATDNVGVTGYLVNESASKPAAGNWPTTVPLSYTFSSAGTKTLYAWARDLAGNVSNSLSGTVTIDTGSSNDVESPEVMEFTLPLTSTSLTVPILAFRAIDNVAPTAYLITTTSAAPDATATRWSATPPKSYTFSSTGAKTLYGWAKDAAGNISESLWDNVDITGNSGQDPADISVKSALEFEGVVVNGTKRKELKVSNQGKATLRVTKIEVAGTDPAAFKPAVTSITVKPSAEYKLLIEFKPTSQRSYRATLRIHSNDPDTPVKEVALSGSGIR